MVGKWIRGEPTDPNSNLTQPAILLFFNNFANGTVFSFEIRDTFVYSDNNNVKKMSIADSYILWDGNLGVWNCQLTLLGSLSKLLPLCNTLFFFPRSCLY